MTILTVGSTNPDFSHIVSKNPATALASRTPFSKPLRLGRVYGWFSKKDNSEFRVLFQDSPTEVSYSDRSEFEYLDISRYNHPFAYLGMISEMLSTAAKGQERDIGGFEAYVSFYARIPKGVLNYITVPEGTVIKIPEVTDGGDYRDSLVTLKTPTVKQALQLTQAICIIAAITVDDIFIPRDASVILKYLRILNESSSTYKMKRMFLTRAVSNKEMLDRLHADNLINTNGVVFQYGNNQYQRFCGLRAALVGDGIAKSETLIDIGAGELYHSIKLLGFYKSVEAFDVDPLVVEDGLGKIKGKNLQDKISYTCLEINKTSVEDLASTFEDSDVIISEVLEHMPKENARELLRAILETGANKVVIMTPCSEFNKYYDIKDGFRHFDHKWEPTRAEFEEFVKSACPPNRKAVLSALGDTVDGIPCSLMAEFENA